MRDNTVIIENEEIEVRFGWDAFPKQRSMGLIGGLLSESTSVDCDACAIFCDKNGKPLSTHKEEVCLSFDNASMFGNAVFHNGDNRTGDGLDDEIINIDLNALPAEVGIILFTLDIFKERKRKTLGKIQNTFIRITRKGNKEEIGRYDFNNLGSSRKMVVCGLLKREKRSWTFVPPQQEIPNVNSVGEYINILC